MLHEMNSHIFTYIPQIVLQHIGKSFKLVIILFFKLFFSGKQPKSSFQGNDNGAPLQFAFCHFYIAFFYLILLYNISKWMEDVKSCIKHGLL